MRKLLIPLMVIALALTAVAALPTTVYAQEEDPGPSCKLLFEVEVDGACQKATAENSILALALNTVVLFGTLGYGSSLTTEFLKDLLRRITSNKYLKLLFPEGTKSAYLAAIVAALIIFYGQDYGLTPEFFQQFDFFKEAAPELITFLNGALVFGLSSLIKKEGLLTPIFTAVPAATYAKALAA